MQKEQMSRRDCLTYLGVAGAGSGLSLSSVRSLAGDQEIAGAQAVCRRRGDHVSRRSHADVLIGRIVEGWRHQGGPGPAPRLASLYIDQPADSELGLRMAAKHSVPICKTIEEAITLGRGKVAVDGIISVV